MRRFPGSRDTHGLPPRVACICPRAAAYAAPFILLAQTRQADRDKAHKNADALHREALANESAEREAVAATQTAQLMVLMEQNTE
jgi:uncharacterized membrane protein